MSLLVEKSWIDFLLKIKEAKEELNNPEIIWYRGQGDARFYLLPSLLRYENGLEKEQSLFHKFKRFGDKIFSTKDSEWETLFDMQHYGIPTRLIDWTETFGIAIFFACYRHKTDDLKGDAAIYLLNPLELNKVSKIDKIVRVPYEEKDFPYSGIYWQNRPFGAHAPIAVEPVFKNNRLTAQRGMFTVHHDTIEPIEDKFPNAIKKVTIPKVAIPSAQEFLEYASIDEFSVFPDLAGVANYMMKTSGLKTNNNILRDPTI